jgi:signal transduction histidine kinase/CheY-like chemotaxis protein
MILFFYYSRNNIDEQKKNIEAHERIIDRIKNLVQNIDQAQQKANSYIATKDISHLDTFHIQLYNIEKQIDTLKIITTDSVPVILFKELEVLLIKKGETVTELSKLFCEQQSFPDKIREKIKTYESSIQPDSIEIKTHQVEETILKNEAKKKKNLWQKIASVFSPKQSSRDTIITVSREIIDTIKITPLDSLYTTLQRDTLVEKVKLDYKNHITSIEERVILLILSDQEISSNIFDLLTDLYDNLLDSRLDEIKNNEHWLRNINTISIFIGLIALFLILLFIILIINNVNKGLHMRKSLEIANKRTKQLMESRHQLLLSVSHDIKTPLNSILGYLELNNNQNQLTTQDLSSMRNSGKYILALLENLLEFSSLQLGTLTASQTAFSILALCNEIKEMFVPLAKHKGLQFDCIYEFGDSLYITSDLLKLKQIIINILSNAIKYTPSGKIKFTVRFENEILFIQVSDTGIGIPNEQINQIFQPFRRIDENKNVAEGTGFGMYVVKGLIDLLEGIITIESEIDKGTTISVELPALSTMVEYKEALPLKIYVVDDDPAFSNMLTKMLSQLGHTAISINSIAAFEESKQHLSTSDLIITDMEMGDISGTDILKTLRKIHPSLPIYIITGRSDFSKEQAYKLGFNGYLPKPVTLNELSSLINQTPMSHDYLKSLREMFDNDESAIQEIVDVFINTTNENLNQLEYCIKENTFSQAQTVCHKMLPMFLQMGLNEISDFLKKMDQLRGVPPEGYPSWKEDGSAFIKEAIEILTTIEKYR